MFVVTYRRNNGLYRVVVRKDALPIHERQGTDGVGSRRWSEIPCDDEEDDPLACPAVKALAVALFGVASRLDLKDPSSLIPADQEVDQGVIHRRQTTDGSIYTQLYIGEIK